MTDAHQTTYATLIILRYSNNSLLSGQEASTMLWHGRLISEETKSLPSFTAIFFANLALDRFSACDCSTPISGSSAKSSLHASLKLEVLRNSRPHVGDVSALGGASAMLSDSFASEDELLPESELSESEPEEPEDVEESGPVVQRKPSSNPPY